MDEVYSVAKLAVEHNKLSTIRKAFITSKSLKSIFVQFDIRTSDWDDTAITAVFNGKSIRILDDTYMCDIPLEAIDSEGEVDVGLFGVKDDYRINTNKVRMKVFEGCYEEVEEEIEITQSLFDQIMAAVAGKADRNHNHDGRYVKIGEALIEETDPTVPEWAKQPNKPTYTYDEIEGTPDVSEQLESHNADPHAHAAILEEALKLVPEQINEHNADPHAHEDILEAVQNVAAQCERHASDPHAHADIVEAVQRVQNEVDNLNDTKQDKLIADNDDYYTAETVDGALQEIGEVINHDESYDLIAALKDCGIIDPMVDVNELLYIDDLDNVYTS